MRFGQSPGILSNLPNKSQKAFNMLSPRGCCCCRSGGQVWTAAQMRSFRAFWTFPNCCQSSSHSQQQPAVMDTAQTRPSTFSCPNWLEASSVPPSAATSGQQHGRQPWTGCCKHALLYITFCRTECDAQQARMNTCWKNKSNAAFVSDHGAQQNPLHISTAPAAVQHQQLGS